jgi:nanoRNase/pAp phosphatase (c-di-AMP/oligoRNAs hydrolase)
MKHQEMIDAIGDLWKKSQSILLTGASNLDGDALGCILALESLGRKQGKNMTIANEKPLSSLYDFLGKKDLLVTTLSEKTYDAIFICDTGCFDML